MKTIWFVVFCITSLALLAGTLSLPYFLWTLHPIFGILSGTIYLFAFSVVMVNNAKTLDDEEREEKEGVGSPPTDLKYHNVLTWLLSHTGKEKDPKGNWIWLFSMMTRMEATRLLNKYKAVRLRFTRVFSRKISQLDLEDRNALCEACPFNKKDECSLANKKEGVELSIIKRNRKKGFFCPDKIHYGDYPASHSYFYPVKQEGCSGCGRKGKAAQNGEYTDNSEGINNGR